MTKSKTELKFNELSSIAKIKAMSDEIRRREKLNCLNNKEKAMCKKENDCFKVLYIYSTQIRGNWRKVFKDFRFNKNGEVIIKQYDFA